MIADISEQMCIDCELYMREEKRFFRLHLVKGIRDEHIPFGV